MEQYNEQPDLRITDINQLEVGQTILVPRQVNGKSDMAKAQICAILETSPYWGAFDDKRIYAYGKGFADYYSIDECLLAEDESDDDVPF